MHVSQVMHHTPNKNSTASGSEQRNSDIFRARNKYPPFVICPSRILGGQPFQKSDHKYV